MTMRERARNIAVPLFGVIAAVLFFRVSEWVTFLGFENPDPPLLAHTGPLWGLLILAIPLGIGYFATRLPVLQSAVVCSVVCIILFVHTDSAAYPSGHIFPPGAILRIVRDDLGCVVGACILAFFLTWLINGVKKRPGGANMNVSRTWLLVVAEAIALAIFFYCAQIARDLDIDIAALEFYDVDDARVRLVEWHTYATEAFWTIVALWLVATVRAIDQYIRAGNSLSELSEYRPPGLVAVALLLPVAGLLGGFVFDLFLHGL